MPAAVVASLVLHSSPIYATATAKIGGGTRPCIARQKMSCERVVASPTINVGMTRTNIAATMTRFLPSTSATVPVNGAVSATASVLTVMIVDISAAVA